MRLNNKQSTELTNETLGSESSWQEPRQGTLAKASACQRRLHVERRRRRQRQFTDSSTTTTAASNSGTVTSDQPQSTARPSVDDSVQRRRGQNPTSNRRRRRDTASSRRRSRSDRGPTPTRSRLVAEVPQLFKSRSPTLPVVPQLFRLTNIRTLINQTATKPFNLRTPSGNCYNTKYHKSANNSFPNTSHTRKFILRIVCYNAD